MCIYMSFLLHMERLIDTLNTDSDDRMRPAIFMADLVRVCVCVCVCVCARVCVCVYKNE